MDPKLSICIATYNRGGYIGQTLDSILCQMEPCVEVVVVDGASLDDTPEVVSRYLSLYPNVRYFRENENSGVDADFDKAVGYAKGEYCWLMSDDDLLLPDAVPTVLAALGGEEDLIVANAEVRNVDLSEVLEKQRLLFDNDRAYRIAQREAFFTDTAAYLSFIGCVVIRRTFWLSRDRMSYYGSLFIHVGVIFQSPPVASVKVIAKPLITIRYGNAMWTSRGFEIWMFKWPKLIWSFPDYSDGSKRKICRREPWRSAESLFHNRALGNYTLAEFRRFWPSGVVGLERLIAYCLSVFPASLANVMMVVFFSLLKKPAHLAVQNLLYSRNSGFLSRLLARIFSRSSR